MNDNEKKLLGSIIQHGADAGELLRVLKQEYFSNIACGNVFDYLYNAYQMKQVVLNPAQLCKVMEDFDGISAIVDDICSAGRFIDLDNAETIADVLKREYLENKFRQDVQTADADTIIKLSEKLEKDLSKERDKTPANILEYLKTDFAKDLEKIKNTPIIKTGLDNFDSVMNGLYAGLYVVGAISSLGKTTLIHQISDNIAESGTPVLYFSLEMSRIELITKSITRISVKQAMKQGLKMQDINERCKPSIYWRSHGINNDAGEQALKTYAETVAPNMNILQGDFGTDITTIRTEVQRFVRRNADKPHPVVVIDYLQIIKPAEDKRGTTKENIDYTVTELKRISRDYNIPVIVISSFNRNNYMTPVSFESFKESGGIEYTADVVIGLQLDVLNNELFENPKATIKAKRDSISKAKDEIPRRVDMHVLKNRYGRSESKIIFEYNPMYELFVPGKDIADTVFTVTADTPRGYKPSQAGKGFK